MYYRLYSPYTFLLVYEWRAGIVTLTRPSFSCAWRYSC